MKHAIASILRAVAERLDPQPEPVQQTLHYTATAWSAPHNHAINGTWHPPARF